ncbi:MAG: TlpA family protein disulfide reductase [Acidobacteria bacterium]|nr:TlpA family protein disulfide reductase [Acidobacteriota bacterium]
MNKMKTLQSLTQSISLRVVVLALLSIQAAAQNHVSFTTPDGGSVALAAMRGNVVVLLFGGVTDPQCRSEIKMLEALSERYAGKKVEVYWVSIDNAANATDAQLKSPCGVSTSVKILRDASRSAFKQFGGRQLPTIVVLDQQGQISGQARGGFNPNADFVNDIAQIVDRLL